MNFQVLLSFLFSVVVHFYVVDNMMECENYILFLFLKLCEKGWVQKWITYGNGTFRMTTTTTKVLHITACDVNILIIIITHTHSHNSLLLQMQEIQTAFHLTDKHSFDDRLLFSSNLLSDDNKNAIITSTTKLSVVYI